MSKVYFGSDWHLGHKNILKYRSQFSTIEEHDQHFIDNFNKTVTKRDTVYLLGDIAFTDEALEKLKTLKKVNKLVLVLGNHDYLNSKKYLEVFDDVFGIKSLKNFWISHCPIHPQEIRNRKGNIHGHLHKSVLEDKQYFDVCPEKNNYELVDFEDIKQYFINSNINNTN